MNIRVGTTPRTLREAIAQSKFSIDQLAAKLGCSKRSIDYWRGGKRPSDQYIAMMSDILRIDLWQIYNSPETDTNPTNSLGYLSIPFPIDEEPTITSIDKGMRLFVQQEIEMLWSGFHAVEGKESIRTLKIALNSHSQTLNTLTSLIKNDDDQQWLLCALSDIAILTGRIYRDQLNHEEAIRQHKLALKLAMRSESETQIVAATFRLTETLKDAGLIYDALGYLKAGLPRAAKANARVSGELLGLASEIYMLLGDEKVSEDLVNQSAHLAVGAALLPTAGGINFSVTAAASYQMFVALKKGDILKAQSHIERGIQQLKTEFSNHKNIRWESHLYIRLARAYMSSGDLDAACHALDQAAQLAHSISSKMAFLRVQDAIHEVNARQLPAFRQLQQKILYLASRS